MVTPSGKLETELPPVREPPRESDYRSPMFKLVMFSIAMVVLPIGSYFLSLKHVYSGNTTPAGITAAVVANVVLGAYVLAAMAEDASDAAETERRKRQ